MGADAQPLRVSIRTESVCRPGYAPAKCERSPESLMLRLAGRDAAGVRQRYFVAGSDAICRPIRLGMMVIFQQTV